MAKDIRSIDVRDGAATHETSNPKAREHWSSREEKMLERFAKCI